MKKYLITLIPVVLLGWQSGPDQEKRTFSLADSSSKEDIKPIPSQYKAEELTTRILSNYHYRKTKLDDSLSAIMLKTSLTGLTTVACITWHLTYRILRSTNFHSMITW